MRDRGLLELPALPPVRVRRHPRAKRLILRVQDDGQVVLTLPMRASLKEAEGFIRRQASWIQAAASEAGAEVEVPTTVDLPVTGEAFSVSLDPSRSTGVGESSAHLCLAGAAGADWQQGLLRWYLARARSVLPPMLRRLSLDTGLVYRRTQVRRQRTRWGSCSESGTISLNAALMFQSAEVVRYLMLHELCHTRHMDHSPRFYALLRRLEPDWERLDVSLMTDGRGRIPRWAR